MSCKTNMTSVRHLRVACMCAWTWRWQDDPAPAPVGGGLPLPPSWIKSGPLARGLARHNKRFITEEIIKIVTTRCQSLRLKCTKSFVGWGSAPDPAGGAYSDPPGPLAGF